MYAEKPVCIVSGKTEAMAAAEADIGAAVLPCCLGDCSSRLERVSSTKPKQGADIWLLHHQALPINPHVREFPKFATHYFKDEEKQFKGS